MRRRSGGCGRRKGTGRSIGSGRGTSGGGRDRRRRRWSDCCDRSRIGCACCGSKSCRWSRSG